jgi:hypothetical protein
MVTQNVDQNSEACSPAASRAPAELDVLVPYGDDAIMYIDAYTAKARRHFCHPPALPVL